MTNLNFKLTHLKMGRKDRVLDIRGINFSLDDTEKVAAIIGESGLGKTTIYKSLFSAYVNLWKKESLVEFKCDHTIYKNKLTHDVILKGKEKPNFGFATQVPYFYSYKTVEDNLFLPVKWLESIEDTNDFRESYLSKFDLTQLRNSEMHHLSGGQRQIVNLARVFLSNPELVIIDESFSNMNEAMAEKYFDLIRQNYPNTIIFLTSHRTSDIVKFKAKKINLIRRVDESNCSYVTVEL